MSTETENKELLRIYDSIHQIERVLDTSPRTKSGAPNKRVVDITVLHDLLGDLKVGIPEDVRRAHSIILNTDNILKEAEQAAQDIINEAENQSVTIIEKSKRTAAHIVDDAHLAFEKKVSESEITAEAQRRARALMQQSVQNATHMYDGAKSYVCDMLGDLLGTLEGYCTQVATDRDRVSDKPVNSRVEYVDEEEPDYDEDDVSDEADEAPVYESQSQPKPKKSSAFASMIRNPFKSSDDDKEAGFADDFFSDD